MTRNRPSPEQIEATDPGHSSWVGANAGSGKTHVLTQRVARLLLQGAEPQKILCLTYTKAAASEMQTRLFRMLGEWAMAPADRLAETLADLSGTDRPVGDADALAAARRLFARALETPGGLRIQTIHAFCEALLRRFPLEAGLSPRYEVADERRAAVLLAAVREAMAESRGNAFDCAARLLDERGIDALAEAVLACRKTFEPGDADRRIAAHFGPDEDEEAIAQSAIAELAGPEFAALRAVLLRDGGAQDRLVGEALPAGTPSGESAVERAEQLIRAVLTRDRRPRSPRGFPVLEVKRARPSADAEMARLADWAVATHDRLCAARMARRARDLHAFAEALLDGHAKAKEAQALLDFDDLVHRACALLTNSVMRAWVLYKLDQGIDHILVDEAQDTAPQQWQVVAAIAEEFLSGEGARGGPRSIFVVGDTKQSIFSFQGAEPQEFGRMRRHFAERFGALGAPLRQPALVTSYRSAPAILRFVDAVFDGEAGAGLTVGGERVHHVAHRQEAFGRVDLWPLIEPEAAPEPPEWWRPVDQLPPSDPRERLAAAVAEHVRDLIGQSWLAARERRPARRVRPGDILILVAKRYPLAAGIVHRLKALGVPVAGADRLRLSNEIAVQDLLALAKVACQPGDDLSLAALLRSPLCGLGEGELFELAHGRAGSLWQAVQTSGRHGQAARLLSDMAARADFLRPYEFFEHALVRHDGRRRLLARLGPEAEDAIDELLAQALAYESAEAPSLAGFVAWIEQGDIEVRREMESGGDVVRVMTVHGAKGLEAPIVILPDTVSAGRRGAMLLPAVAEGGLPPLTIWPGAKDGDDPVSRAAKQAAQARERAERKRLLYVALTRAEDWLVICGAEQKGRGGECWYDMLAEGMARCAGVTMLPSPTGAGEMRRFESGAPPQPSADSPVPIGAAPLPLPPWLGPAPREARPPRFSPSALGGAEPHGGAGIGRETALRMGLAVHLLLERLADRPAGDRPALARRLLDAAFPDLDPEQRRRAWEEVERVLAMPESATVFGPDSLAEVSAVMPGPDGRHMTGRIDRLVLGPGEALIVDIKSDRIPPASPADVPLAYLAQLGAYRLAVAAAFPGREVTAALLWTARPSLMPINRQLTDRAFQASLVGSSPAY